MFRSALAALLLFASSAVVWAAETEADAPVPPTTYELMIDGESFLVQLDNAAKLDSSAKPGTSFRVALRVAMRQRVELNTLEFQYDWPATLSDDRGRTTRTIRLRHDLGFDLHLTDLGQPVSAESRDEGVKLLIESVSESLRESKASNVTPGTAHERKFGGCDGKGVAISYQDSQGYGHTCLVYLLCGEKFAASSMIQYFDKDAENVLPRIKGILDSVQQLKRLSDSAGKPGVEGTQSKP